MELCSAEENCLQNVPLLGTTAIPGCISCHHSRALSGQQHSMAPRADVAIRTLSSLNSTKDSNNNLKGVESAREHDHHSRISIIDDENIDSLGCRIKSDSIHLTRAEQQLTSEKDNDLYQYIDTKFCDNLKTNINITAYGDTHISIFAPNNATRGANYPFWFQCYLGNGTIDNYLGTRNNYSLSDSSSLIVSETSIKTPTGDYEKATVRDNRYQYLVEVAMRCEHQLLERCQSFRLGLLSSEESSKCPTCGLGDQNCENVHRCSSECGQIRSVNYPFNYGNNHRCRWSIRAPDTYYVNLSIIDFDIPSANNATKLGTCIFDYLTLIDGYTGKRLGCYCNENLPPPYIVSPWNELIIQFDTNSETTGRGFYFQYEFMKLELDEKIRRQLKPNPNILELDPARNASSSTGACLFGWQYFAGSCYRAYIEPEPLQWYDAENKCNLHGKGLDSHLVSILDKNEMLVILYWLTNVWRSRRYRDYYIGLIDVSREGLYRWSDNNPMSYTDWELKSMLLEEETPAQPDGGAYEDCTIIRYNSFSRTSNWHDVPCSLGKHYHSPSEKNASQLTYKWDYVNSYICKSDSLSISSRSKFRRPLFSNEFKPSAQNSNLIKHLAGQNNTARTISSTSQPAAQSAAQSSNETTSNSSSVDYAATIKNRFHLSVLDDNRYFVCDNLEVISVVLRCDGIAHCRDGSDESSGCDPDCLDWQFKCANGRCISIGYYCDFQDDCGDGSDESRCERHRCKLNEFRCQSGQCIPAGQRCDLLPDCSDSSDEGKLCTVGSNCNSLSTFQCYNGNCIPHYAVCDFQIDCPGKFHEDEDKATCDLLLKSRSLDYKLYASSTNYQTSSVAYYQVSQQEAADSLYRQNLFRCTSGNMINSSLRCLYEFDRYGFQIGCRDVSHLSDCVDFACPQRDYVKCSNSYCIPWRYICDGKWDCIMGDDELGCARYVCPGQYKCANQSSCILLHQLCDGLRQCPMGDDEWFCDLQCPSRCDCIGQSVNCRGANLTAMPTNYISKSVRKLDLSYNRLGPNLSASDFSAYHDLAELILHHNGIEVLIPRKFHQLRNLYKLDLSNNQIHSVKRGAFAGLRRVTQLLLESNPELVILEPEAFLGLSSLQMLNISSSRILALRKNTFDGLTSLRHLLLRSNMIVEIEDGAFRSLSSLVSLDMRGNEIRYFTKLVFSELKSLRNLSTDSFKFCCLMRHQIPADRCLPLPDAISDCEDLLSSVPQRTCIWIAGIVAVIGNFIVIIWRYRDRFGHGPLEERAAVNSRLLLSLGCSDLLMGIFLLIIAVADTWYRGRYIENADNWRESSLCNLCGFLSTVSSEASVFTLVSIAFNRYTEICGPLYSPYKFTLEGAHHLIRISWCIALTVATLLLLITPYFRGQLYARSGVCLAFHITNQKAAGWLYMIVVIILVVNLMAFIFIVFCYSRIYMKMSQASKNSHLQIARATSGAEKPKIQQIQGQTNLNIALILITNFVACFPTIILRLISLAGIPLPAAVYSWIAVLVLPVNSAINPMIYTIPNIRRQIKILTANHRARKSAAQTSAGQDGHLLAMTNYQKGTELAYLASDGSDQLHRLTKRNVPPGYVPIRQFLRQCQSSQPDPRYQLVGIGLEIARDLEDKHRELRVYSSLELDDVYVSDKIPAVSESQLPTISVFLADHKGYLPKWSRCRHPKPATGGPKKSSCECHDVVQLGDILIKLIQLYNVRKQEEQLEEVKQRSAQANGDLEAATNKG